MADSPTIHSPVDLSPIKFPRSQPKSAIMDFRPSKSLTQGIKRVGGRSGVSRLGQSSRRGRPIVSKRY